MGKSESTEPMDAAGRVKPMDDEADSYWRGDAQRYAQNADYWRGRAEKAESQPHDDTAERKAGEVLPCLPSNGGWVCGNGYHSIYCPAHYRFAVAAMIREKDAEIERLRKLLAVSQAEIDNQRIANADLTLAVAERYGEATKCLKELAELKMATGRK